MCIMKRLFYMVFIILLIDEISGVAKQEKIIKKPLNLKPPKGSKSVLDQFKDHLSPEDAEFIKQIDQQFKAHGDKLSIKVERENGTKTNKNTKRTIDDSLGYSYQQNMPQNSYYFSRPIYMHKFTSRDVPLEKGYTNEKATDIEIQQSHSYELKNENIHYQNAESQNSYHQKQVYEDPVPVIVLRVPGPSKYALHLQALLQQYLELRAAQFLKVLEDQDRHGQLMHPSHYVAPQEQVAYIPMIAISPMYNNGYRYQQPHQYNSQHGHRQYYHQQPPTRHHENVYRIPVGDQSYYRQASIQHHQPQQYQKYHSNVYHNQPQQSQQHLSYPATSFITYVTPAYVTPVPQDEHQNEPLQTSENYPSDKHTHVIFKKKKNRIHNHPQPSVTYHQAEPIVVPEVPIHYNHETEQQSHQEVQSHPEEYHHEHSVTHEPNYEHENEHSVVAITERTKSPYNYHIAGPTLAPTPSEIRERQNPKRMAPFTKEQFEKAKRIMEKSKRNRGSTKLERVIEQTEAKSSS